ncbi:MAG: hypothetical protein AB7I18_07795 [Candidatus Berkiella sp.]
MGKQGVRVQNNLIELAIEKISNIPMQFQPGQTDYKINVINVLKQINQSNFLDSDKDRLLIVVLEVVVEADQKEIKAFRKEFGEILDLLNEAREKKLQPILQKESPKKSALKNENSRKKGINVQFNLDKNTEAAFHLEQGRELSVSTKEFKQGERDKYQAKRTPDEKGEVKLKRFGENPPVAPQAKPYQGRWMPEGNLKELQTYFESPKKVEAANITLNQDGTYRVEIFKANSKVPKRYNYDLDEMHDMLFGSRLQNHLNEALGQNHPVTFTYFGRENYATFDIENLNDDQLISLLAALVELKFNLQEEDIEALPDNQHRLYLRQEDILNALIDHPSLLQDLKNNYEQALQVVAEQAIVSQAKDQEPSAPEKPSPRR